MQIRGVELDFRLYDEDKADVKNRYFEELKKMGEIKKEMPSGTEAEKNRYLCSRIKGMFDNVFGEGTGEAVYANHGWLKTHHTFSFANYYNPERVHFGMLRVLNDDSVAPGEGFDMHPHKNMEVISIPLKGYLRHGDSIKNSEVITPGDIQVMSAGTGIVHSEFNDSGNEQLEFLQIWVFPREENTKPHYASYDVRPVTSEKNKLSLIIAPDGSAPASINQDAWFSLGNLDAGQVKEYKLHSKNNGVYLFVIDGEVEVSNTILSKRDGAGFWETDSITIEVLKHAKVLLIEIPMMK